MPKVERNKFFKNDKIVVKNNRTGKIRKLIFPHEVDFGLEDYPEFAEKIKFFNGLSGSLTHLPNGTSYLIAGTGIQIATGSNGAVTITNNGSGAGTITGVTAGSSLSGGGTTGNVTLNLDINGLAGLTAATFDDDDYFVVYDASAGDYKKVKFEHMMDYATDPLYSPGINSDTDGRLSLDINSLSADTLDPSTDFIAFSDEGTANTPSKKTSIDDFLTAIANTGLSVSSGLLSVANLAVSEGGTGAISFADKSVIITQDSGTDTLIAEPMTTNGSLLIGGTSGPAASTLTAGTNISITNGDGSIIITASGVAPGAAGSDTEVQFNDGGSALGTDSTFTFNKATNTLTVPNLSGSLTRLSDDTSYLVAGNNIEITTASNGQITISGTGTTVDTTATSTYATHYLTFVDSASSTVNETLRVDSGITYNPSTNDLTVSGYFQTDRGIKRPTSVLVNSSYTTGENKWLKIAQTFNGHDTSNTTFASFLVVFTGYEWNTSYDGDFAYIINVKFTGYDSSPYYFSPGTYVTVEPLHAGNLEGFDPSTDVQITFNNTSLPSVVELWVKSKEQFKHCFVSHLGGTNSVDANVADPGFEILTGQSDSTSVTSLGTDIYGQYTSKVFNALSGSLTKLSDGTSYLIAGGATTITTGSNGSVTISSTNNQYNAGDGLVLNGGTLFEADLKTGGGLEFYLTQIQVDDSIVATLTGSDFSGTVKAPAFSGSLTHLEDGTSYLIAGNNVVITTGSNGAVTINATMSAIGVVAGSDTQIQFNDGGSNFGADANFTFNKTTDTLTVTNLSSSLTRLTDGTSYLVAGPNISITTQSNGSVLITGSEGNEYTAGTGLNLSAYQFSINDSIVATLTGSQFSGNIGVTGSIEATSFFSGSMFKAPVLTGSLTQLHDGTSYLIAGNNITIASQSNGSIIISAQDDDTLYTAGTGLILDSGEFSINDSVVATLTGSQFSGTVIAPAFSGSLTQLEDGTSYLIAGSNITIVTGSNGSITISSTASGGGGGGSGDPNAEYVLTTATGSLSNGKVIEAGPGITLTTGASTVTISSDISAINGREKTTYFITASHSAFSSLDIAGPDFATVFYDANKIDINLNGQLLHTGSSAQVIAGERDYYLSSTGSIVFGFDLEADDIVDAIISVVGGGSGGGAGDPSASYLVLSNTGSLSNERSFIAGTGLIGTDAGANNNYTLTIDDSIVATLTGSFFTGTVSAPALSGSLTRLQDGSSYLVAGENVSIASGSNGQITISTTGTRRSRSKNSYEVSSLVVSGTAFATSGADYSTAGYLPDLIDVHLNGQLLLSGTDAQVGLGVKDYFIYNNTNLKFGFDLSPDDIVSVSVISFDSTVNSYITDQNASYLVITNTGSLSNERSISIGAGLTATDGGSGNSYSIVNNNGNYVFNEYLGQGNGTNTLFTLDYTPTQAKNVSIYVNGLLQMPATDITSATFQDYSVTGSNIYFTTASLPDNNSIIMANYTTNDAI